MARISLVSSIRRGVKADVRNRDKLERKLSSKLAELSSGWLTGLLDELGDPPLVENINSLFWTKVKEQLAGFIAPFLEEIFLDQARDSMLAQPIGVDWALVNEGAVTFARDYTFELVEGVNRHSERTLRKAVSAYYEREQTIGDLQRSISHLYGPTRAEAIAVTEITRAAAEGEYQIAKELRKQGVDMVATWVTNADEIVRKCPICWPLHRRKASGLDALGKPYWIHPNNGNSYQHPAHPRCRCWAVHKFEEPEQKPAVIEADGIQPSPESYDEEGMDKVNDWYIGDDNVDNRVDKANAKDDICLDIAERSGLEYEDVNDMVGTWAQTSNDDNPDALHIQQRASEIFGIEPSEWQLSKMDNYTDLSSASLWTDDEIDSFLKAMYENTQDELASAGLDTIKLQRGIYLDTVDLDAMTEAGLKIGDSIILDQNVMESWTYDPYTSENFGNVILEADVPANRIISTARTGIGCLDEYEFIVSGSDFDEYATITELGG